MRVPMFERAKKTHKWCEVTKIESQPDIEFWEVIDPQSNKPHSIRFERHFPKGCKIPYYTLSCDCTICSLHPKENPLCSHKVAFLMTRIHTPQFVVDFNGKVKQ